MSVYKSNLSTKIFFILTFLGFNVLCFSVLLIGENINFFEFILFILAFLIFILSLYAIFIIRIIIDEEKIIISTLFLYKTRQISLFWKEIKQVDSTYFFFPETIGWITLIPYDSINKKNVTFPWTMISVSVVEDIINHLSRDTKLYLYPYLKNKLEGKRKEEQK